MDKKNVKILVVDDESSLRDVMSKFLDMRGYSVDTAESGEIAIDLFNKNKYDLVITDIKMPGISGVDLLKEIKSINKRVPVIICTGFPTVDTAVNGLKLGAYDYITKPFHFEEIEEKIERAINLKNLEDDNAAFSKLVALHEVTKSLTSTHDIVELNEKILKFSVKLSKSSGGALFFFGENNKLNLITATPQPLGRLFWNNPIFSKLGRWSLANAIPFIADSSNVTDPEIVPKLPDGTSSLLSFPLMSSKGVLGILILVRDQNSPQYTNVDLEIMNVISSQAAISLDNVRLYQNIRDNYLTTISSFAVAVEAKDSYTHGHSENVMKYTLLLAEKMGLSEEEKELYKYGGLLHDIGKIGVSEAVLNKPGKLTDEEFEEIKKHPELGAQIIHNVPYFSRLVPLVKYHHEFYNGKGYPDGLAGEEIPFGARMLSVADAFEAMTSNRPYRTAMPFEKAFSIIESCKGTQFDSEISDLFIDVMREWQKSNEIQ